jgi:hypothetical protein
MLSTLICNVQLNTPIYNASGCWCTTENELNDFTFNFVVKNKKESGSLVQSAAKILDIIMQPGNTSIFMNID